MTINSEVIAEFFLSHLPGDTNCDENATVADSVAILQSIANNDKNALSAQGKFNGDISGDCDGTTSADARILQEWDSNKQ